MIDWMTHREPTSIDEIPTPALVVDRAVLDANLAAMDEMPDELADWSVGDRVRLKPAHIDPTIAKHEYLWILNGEDVVDRWDVDLRHW